LDQFETFRSSEIVSGQDLKSIDALERSLILNALQKVGWRIEGKNGAAEFLGLKASTLRYRIVKYGIVRE
jgi:transcriptional regulator with GAF, ATPase, and Fis domain